MQMNCHPEQLSCLCTLREKCKARSTDGQNVSPVRNHAAPDQK
jgi:hypothetical protein